MIIYGSNGHNLTQELLPKYTCPQCQETGRTFIHVAGRYAHVYWIPLFSTGRRGAAICTACGHEQKPSKGNDAMRYEWERIKANTRLPIWHFSGAFLLFIAVLAGVYFSGQRNEERQVLYASPQAGDVYYYKEGGSDYSSMKIASVDGDSLYVFYNNYSINKSSQVDEIDQADRYMELKIGVSRSEINQMIEEGTIYDVIR